MKVIDLLNKIANGEIEANTELYYKDEKYRHIDHLFEDYYVEEVLNDEVEIIEEDNKIEEIDMFDYFTGYDYGGTNKKLLTDLEYNFVKLNSKINEIIDYINKEVK